MVIFLLLVLSWFWQSGHLRLSFENFPQGLFLVFLISVGLTIVYFFLLRLSRHLAWQVRAQFFLDGLLITWLVWRTGDLSSPYITLYIVLISVASFFRSRCLRLDGRDVDDYVRHACSVDVRLSDRNVRTYDGIRQGGTDRQLSRGRLPGGRPSRGTALRTTIVRIELEEATKTLANLRVLHKRIIESIRSGLVTTDLDGQIFTFNAAAAEITGHSADAVRGKSIFEMFGDIRDAIDVSLKAVDSGEQPPRFEADLITPEGFAVRIGYAVSQLLSESNEATGLIITFQDLTEIRSMEESVRGGKIVLQQLGESQQDSHMRSVILSEQCEARSRCSSRLRRKALYILS